MDLENAAHRHTVQTFWDSPHMAATGGRKAVEMFDAIHDGRIKAVWIMATNPVVSLPDANRVREAVNTCGGGNRGLGVGEGHRAILRHVVADAASGHGHYGSDYGSDCAWGPVTVPHPTTKTWKPVTYTIV